MSNGSDSLSVYDPAGSPALNDSDVVDAGNGVHRLASTQTLEPGYFWTALREVGGDGKADRYFNIGETLLLVDVIEFENRVHSVTLRVHPRHGEGSFTVMVDGFVNAFEPCPDAEQIRQREQHAIMDKVAEIQNELMSTQVNPQLMIEAIKKDVEKEIEKAEQAEFRTAADEIARTAERDKNFAKTHRRAARRSESKGNPLAVPKATLASEVGTIISNGIDASGVAELSKIAGRQAIIAKAQGNWLTSKTDEISRTIKALTPYMSERGAVAMARSSGALKMAESIKRGIESLDLYTGKGVDVFDISTGKQAAPSEPLTLIQGKRYMEEELAAWADVDERFDYQNKESFFKALADNPHLRDQVLPTTRCVVTMAVLRRPREYDNPLEALINNMRNQLVFLLVRNGDNVHVVYSSTPSHEGATRLFPTQNELEKPFRGWDGSRVSIRDIEFGKSAALFDNIALSYKRFLILLCGLDHRLKLLGDFYPEHEQMKFMTADFQGKYFNFIADEENGNLLGDSLSPFWQWMQEHNKTIQSGSRIFAFKQGASNNAAELKRRHSLKASPEQFERPFIALKEGNRFIIRIHASDKYSAGEAVNAKCHLDDESNSGRHTDAKPWWICVDAVQLREVQRYRSSRINRAMGVGYLRLLRRVEAYLVNELEIEKPAREYLLQTAVNLGDMEPSEANSLLTTALSNWRAARRGQAMPGLDEKKKLHEILSLMVPEGRLPGDMQRLVDVYIQHQGVRPLLLTRTGKSKVFLYVEPTEADKAPYPNVLTWGWIKRITLEAGKTKMLEQSTTLLWMGDSLPASETEIARWDGLNDWMHELTEPIALRKYGLIPGLLNNAENCWGPILKAGQGSGLPGIYFEDLMDRNDAVQETINKGYDVPVNLCIPVGVVSRNGRDLNTVYFTCRSEAAMYFYGDDAQRTIVEKRFLRRFVLKHRGLTLLKQMQWQLSISSDYPTVSHDEPTSKSFVSNASWSKRQIQICQKKSRHFFGHNNKGPRWNEQWVNLSFNRAFDELMGASVKAPKRKFYKERQRELERIKSWPFNSPEEKKLKAIALIESSFEHSTRAQCNGLVWSEEKNRSSANSYFKAPFVQKSEAPVQSSDDCEHTEDMAAPAP